MKKLLILVTLAIIGCSFPVQLTAGTPTPTRSDVEAATETLEPTPAATTTPAPTPQPGSEENPLILALAPSPRSSQEVIDAATTLAAQLEALTGYRFVTTAPTSELDLINALEQGNAHVAVLSPFGYLLARESRLVTAGLASLHDGQPLYGAQFIANRESEFESFYDELRNENTAEASVALHQFQEKKPCWSDAASPSGYVVPLGVLNQAEVQVRSGAFLEGQPSVVRAVYSDDICDFGATFIDARKSPTLEADYPDVLERVIVIWQIPAVIPHENVSFAASLPLEIRRVLLRAFVDVMISPEGKAGMQLIYGIDALQPIEDDFYMEFADYVEVSRLDLGELIDMP